MRPNYAQDAPPTEISVGGCAYPCETDYRVWLDVLKQLNEIDLGDTSPEGRERIAERIVRLEETVFGGYLKDEDPVQVINAIAVFSQGYPSAPVRATDRATRTYSFEYDLNEIIIAIRNQSGIDLSYRRKEPFHWWEFLLEFRTLCGDHYILNLMEIRGYKGKDHEMKRRKQAYALPDEFSESEREAYAEFNAMFDEGEKEGESS